jgi:hypothetical protein
MGRYIVGKKRENSRLIGLPIVTRDTRETDVNFEVEFNNVSTAITDPRL